MLDNVVMKKQFKYLIGAFVLTTMALPIYWLWYYVVIIKPNRFLADLEIKMSNNQSMKIPYDKTRAVCHKILRYKDGNHHDAFMMLSLVGNHESIPYLLRALKWEGPPSDDGGASCSTFHCVGALEKTTGMDFGLRYEPWEKWWRQEGSKLPPDVIESKASNYWAKITSKRHVEIQYLDNHEK